MQKKLIIYGISLFIIQASYAMEQIQGQFSLHDIVERDDIGTLNTLLRDPLVDVNVADSLRDYPLHIAVRRKNIPMVQTLLDHNAYADIGDACRRTPLHLAILQGSWAIACTLLDKTKNIDTQDIKGNTVLLSALTAVNIPQDIVYLLLARSPDVNIVNKDGTIPLHCAIRRSLLDIVKRLLQLKANPNAQDVHGDAALHVALKADKFDPNIFLQLFKGSDEHKLNVNIANNDGDTALHIAVRKTLKFAAYKLLNVGVDTSLRNAAGDTALCVALKNDKLEHDYCGTLIKQLQQKAACIADCKGLFPLHLAVKHRIVPAVKVLLNGGKDCSDQTLAITAGVQVSIINVKDTSGNTPLHLALTGDDASLELIELLLNHIAILPTEDKLTALNARDANGNTPLHLAALIMARNKSLSLTIINLLLQNGAETHIRNRYGQKASDLTSEHVSAMY